MSDTTKVNNWSFPFKPKEENLNPIQHLTAMAKAGGGYYPIGKNGQWHGGIHFDDKTAVVFDQSQVCCIADGEVIAYRIDKSYPKSLYLNSAKTTFSAPFSRCFVLVKHRLEAPALPPKEGVTPVPSPSLTFFSLYMHLLDWDSYSKAGAPTAPAFMGETLYSVKPDKAVDSVRGLRVRAAPKNGAVTALLPKGTKVKVAPGTDSSNWRKLLSIVEGCAIPALTGAESWVFIKEMQAVAGEPDTFLVADDADDEEPSLAPQKGLNVRKTGNGKSSDPKTGLLPVGAKFSLKAGTTAYRELQQIIEGHDVLPLSANSTHNINGFVHFGSLEATRSEPVLDQVHVLPKPYPIKAGELIGHLGQYQNHDEGGAKPLLHLEAFSCEDVPAFIAQSRAWANGLPDQQKTLLKVYKGASKLIPHREDINASNPPKTSDAGTTVGVDLIIPQSVLDALPADHKLQASTIMPGSSTPVVNRWWRLDNLLADSSGNPISGWLAEQEPITTRHSPWEWMGYDFIKETGRPIGKAAYFYDALRLLTDEERANYRALVSQEDQGPVKARLYNIIDTNRDNKLTATEIRSALAKPWHAQSIAQLITHHESEWFWKADKWEELDPLMGHIPYVDPNQNWESEKARIKQLSWWESLKGKDGISADGSAWHFQSLGFIGSINMPKRHPRIWVDGEEIELPFLELYDQSKIDESDYVLAASALECEINAIKAVAVTETGGTGSYYKEEKDDAVPSILYERHYFHQLTRGIHSGTNPDISNANRGGYGKFSAQYKKLLKAYKLDSSAALKSASWGRFQIMGRNHISAGYSTIENFVRDISISEKNHLKGFVNFIKADRRLLTAIRERDWLQFALAYNGPAQEGYDMKMRENYEALSRRR
ncbi:N-acetylmuramidase family protein [Stutzerimonas balearica]|uniref:N-acetylmuramidase family protein n=1 Tax=Stutzerimonas balearica TaxID=74829 RepID=UPI0028963209|nr:N-acetylmuramidase family protein [Stutzerimonas balearica]